MAEDNLYEEEERKNGSTGRGIPFLKGFLGKSFLLNLLGVFALLVMLLLLLGGSVIFVMNFLESRSLQQSFTQGQIVEFIGKPPILSWYGGIPIVRGDTSDFPAQMFVVEVKLGYVDNPALNTELIRRKEQIQDLIREYFSSRTRARLKIELQVKADLRNRINFLLINGQISEVVFTEYRIIER